MLSGDSLEHALRTLGRVLAERGLGYELVVVGGSALLLLGIIQRPTKDLDVLALVQEGEYISADPLPAELGRAVRDVADTVGLADDWLNCGPTAQIQSGLPEGFRNRVETLVYGPLVIHIASRIDHIHLKLFAAADQWPSPGKHLEDLRRLAPTYDELLNAARWVRSQDTSPHFPQLVELVLRSLGVHDASG